MIYLIPAVILTVIGWLIKNRKATYLISGYNTASKEKKQEYDVEKLCRYMGVFMYVLATVFLIMAIVSIALDGYDEYIAAIGLSAEAAVSIAGIIYMNTGGRVKK